MAQGKQAKILSRHQEKALVDYLTHTRNPERDHAMTQSRNNESCDILGIDAGGCTHSGCPERQGPIPHLIRGVARLQTLSPCSMCPPGSATAPGTTCFVRLRFSARIFWGFTSMNATHSTSAIGGSTSDHRSVLEAAHQVRDLVVLVLKGVKVNAFGIVHVSSSGYG